MRNFGLILIVSAVAILSSCRDDSPYYTVYPHYNGYSTYSNDTSRFSLPYTHYSVNGYTRVYYPNSRILVREGNYENGHPSGYWKFYYPSGKMMQEGNYANGQLSGYWKFYYESGYLKEEGNYSNNLRSGHWKFYYENGRLQAEGNYSNDLKQGPWKYYYYNGGLHMTETYY